MPKEKILVIEDDKHISKLVKYNLEKAGYDSMVVDDGEEAVDILGKHGADDYVVKPFSPRELVLRIKAILKRGKIEESQQDLIKIGILVIDIPKHRITVNNKELELTPVEFKLLVTLIERKGRIQSRDQLLSDVWDMHSDVFTRTVDTHIKRLREKLGKTGNQIETVRGLGYRFKEANED